MEHDLMHYTTERLAEICEAAMQREIADRTAGAAELAQELKAWLGITRPNTSKMAHSSRFSLALGQPNLRPCQESQFYPIQPDLKSPS